MSNDSRKISVTAVQLSTESEDKGKNIKKILELIDEALKDKPDIIVLPELCSTPYWCADKNHRYFSWAETIPGPTVAAIAEKAKKYSCAIVLPMFEKGLIEGEYYNSAAVIGPDGSLIRGKTPDGTNYSCYRKVHLPVLNQPPVHLDEKYYFRSGFGFPVFTVGATKIGILICWDRCFPEGWRTMALQGADVIFMCSALLSWEPGTGASRAEQFLGEMRTRALENQIFVVGCNKCGIESFSGTPIKFFGQSCVIDPYGTVMSLASQDNPAFLNEVLDLEKIQEARLTLPFYHDRRPDLYSIITESR